MAKNNMSFKNAFPIGNVFKAPSPTMTEEANTEKKINSPKIEEEEKKDEEEKKEKKYP